jgi:Zn ribbon nucleic-acid-binding protein
MSDSVDPWREYDKRLNLAVFSVLGYVPVVFVFMVVTMRLFHTTTPGFVAAFSWMAFSAVAGLRYSTFRCPKCRRLFFIRLWPPTRPIMFIRRCVHCGLPKYVPVSVQSLDAERLPKDGRSA